MRYAPYGLHESFWTIRLAKPAEDGLSYIWRNTLPRATDNNVGASFDSTNTQCISEIRPELPP